MLLRKGVYPYEYMDDWTKLEQKSLPSREEFYNSLKQEECGQEDYAHAQNVWEKFECKTMQDYHDLYLKNDVLLLADVFENSRKFSMLHYNLDLPIMSVRHSSHGMQCCFSLNVNWK